MNFNYVDIVRNGHVFKVLDAPPARAVDHFFWDLFATTWEPFTLSWIEQHSDTTKSFLDIGGWIGPTSVWASKFFKSVHSFEPDPVAFEFLCKNIEPNANNVKIYNYAVTAEQESVSLYSREGLGSSMTSMYTGESSGVVADGFPFSEVLKLDDFGLIKIDIEGGERLLIDTVVEHLVDCPIPLIISLHHAFFLNPDEDFDYVVKKLGEVYSSFTLENGSSVSLTEIPRGFTSILCQ